MLTESSREIDHNGFITIAQNPISRVGVFPYLGSSIGADEPDRVYHVYRPAEELCDSQAVESFKLIPLVDDHTMLGKEDDGLTPAEYKGVHGSTGEEIEFRDGVLYAKLKIFSQTLENLIKQGKKQLSLGYRCVYEKASGHFNGQPYDYIQKALRGNHLALVDEGRMGPQVAVLDQQIAFDHFDLALDLKEFKMADEDKSKDAGEGEGTGKGGMTMEEAHTFMKEMMPKIAKINELLKKHGGMGGEDDDMEAGSAADKMGKDEASVKPSVKPGQSGGPTDDAKDGEEEKAKDEACKDKSAKDAEEKKDGMDAAIKQIAQDVNTLKSGMAKDIFGHIAKRNDLAERLSHHIGTFDHSEKTLEEVARYGVEKLGLKCQKGHEMTALDGFMHARPVSQTVVTFGMDSARSGSKLDAFLKSKAS